jgi:hypothetical protein
MIQRSFRHERAALSYWMRKLAGDALVLAAKLDEERPLVVFADETAAWVRADIGEPFRDPRVGDAPISYYHVKVTDQRGERHRLRVRPEDLRLEDDRIKVAVQYEEEGLVTVRLPGAEPGESAAVFTRKALASAAPGIELDAMLEQARTTAAANALAEPSGDAAPPVDATPPKAGHDE